MTHRTDRFAESAHASYASGSNPFHEQDDKLDALFAASSFGSEEARAIRKHTPVAAREHARRILNGQENCVPADDAADMLTCGFPHSVTSGSAPAATPGGRFQPPPDAEKETRI